MREILIKNGMLHDAVHPESYQSDILIVDGKIARIAPQIDEPGAEIIDAKGCEVYPGFVEAHCL